MHQDQLDELYAFAAEELASENLQIGLWHRMYAEADGDERIAKARYLRARVKQLQGGKPVSDSSSISTHSTKRSILEVIQNHQILTDENVSSVSPCYDGRATFNALDVDVGYTKKVGLTTYQAETDKSGYLDESGAVIIKPIYSEAYHFINNFAVVALGDGRSLDNLRYGVIDKLGRYAVYPEYHAGGVKGGRIYLGKGKKSRDWHQEYLFDPKTKSVQETSKKINMGADLFGANNLVPRQFKEWDKKWPWEGKLLEKWGYVDRAGKWIIQPQFDHAFNFDEGRAFAGSGSQNRELYWLIDENGRKVGRSEFDKLGFFGHWETITQTTTACLKNVGDYGYAHVDRDGRPIYSQRFAGVHLFHGELGTIFATAGVGPEKSCRWGLIDMSGEFIVQPNYEDCFHLFDDFMAVKVGRVWGIMRFSGSWVVEPGFASIRHYCKFKILFEVKKANAEKFGDIKHSWFLVDRNELVLA